LPTLCVLVLSACAGSQSQPTAAAKPTPNRLFPLHAGCAWSYDVDSGDGQSVLATTRVVRAAGDLVEVQTGQSVQTYRVLPDGIQKGSSTAAAGAAFFLLPASLDQWASGPNAEARVISSAESLTTPAGSFSACVVVEELNRDSGQRILTTYCPDVGPTRVISEMKVRGQLLRVQALLRGFTTEAP
jgi:hypothetical protein